MEECKYFIDIAFDMLRNLNTHFQNSTLKSALLKAGYATVHAPPSNSFPPSHTSLFYAVYHRTQHGQDAPTPTQTVEGHGLGGVSLLCKNTQMAPLLSTYPSLQCKS